MKTIKTAVLMTVGVSLLENLWQCIVDNHAIQDLFMQKKMDLPVEKKALLQNVRGYYQLCFPNLPTNLASNYDRLSNVRFPSAEIESFCYWLKEQPATTAIEQVILFPTNTDKLQKCATVIKKNNRGYNRNLCGTSVMAGNL